MKFKGKKPIFISQITDNSIKILKCRPGQNLKKQNVDLECEIIPAQTNDRKITDRILQLFAKLGYKHNPVIISLPRNQAICRYLKVPAQSAPEIEKIVSLQSSRYLPYPANLLITGYQITAKDKEGNSYLNAVIVHKDVIDRYLKIFKELKSDNITIVLSSYGLCNFYRYISPDDNSPIMLIDIDFNQAELNIICRGKLYFSRSFKLDSIKAGWENLFIDEIKKTHEAYLKEVSEKAPVKIILTGTEKMPQDFIELLRGQSTLPIEILSYSEVVSNSDYSFVNLLGLGLKEFEDSLNLIPLETKERARRGTYQKEYIKLTLFFIAAIFIFAIGLAKNFYDKELYLKQINSELDKITAGARPLERMEKKLALLEKRSDKGPLAPDILSALHKIMPAGVSLLNFNFEAGKLITLRGQAPDLNSVVVFNAALEKSDVFKKYNAEIKFTTNRKAQAQEFVDFEIVCLKRK